MDRDIKGGRRVCVTDIMEKLISRRQITIRYGAARVTERGAYRTEYKYCTCACIRTYIKDEVQVSFDKHTILSAFLSASIGSMNSDE